MHVTGSMFDLVGLGWESSIRIFNRLPGWLMQVCQEPFFEDITPGMGSFEFCVSMKGEEDETVICAWKAHIVTTITPCTW